jgi:hypothetical protein
MDVDAAFGTVVAKRELPYARVLARSFAEHHPELPFFVLLADEVEDCFDPVAEPFELILLSELEVPHPERFRFAHTRQPLSYAATPYFISALLDREFEAVVFIKQESLVTGRHGAVLARLERNTIVLTPHLLDPLEGDDRHARELNILQSGVYNVGLLGVRESPTARHFLRWWSDRVHERCRHAIGEGMHYEQRWLDLVPAYFGDAHVLRDPAVNVAHWNLPERAGDGHRLVRFSGFNPERPDWVTGHSERLRTEDLGELSALFAGYGAALREAGWDQAKSWPYAYAQFDNGVPIPDIARELYGDLDERERAPFGNPFSTKGESFFRWLNEPVSPTSRVTRLWRAIHKRRPDLQREFPDLCGEDGHRFLAWTKTAGIQDHAIPRAFVA